MMTVRLQPPSSIPAHPSSAYGLYTRSCQHELDRLCDADGISRRATQVINTGMKAGSCCNHCIEPVYAAADIAQHFHPGIFCKRMFLAGFSLHLRHRGPSHGFDSV
jgi:hypothetical protein